MIHAADRAGWYFAVVLSWLYVQYVVWGSCVFLWYARYLRRRESDSSVALRRIMLLHWLASLAYIGVYMYPWQYIQEFFIAWYSGNVYERFIFTFGIEAFSLFHIITPFSLVFLVVQIAFGVWLVRFSSIRYKS